MDLCLVIAEPNLPICIFYRKIMFNNRSPEPIVRKWDFAALKIICNIFGILY